MIIFHQITAGNMTMIGERDTRGEEYIFAYFKVVF
jgi:hypothetical protein